MAPWWGNARFRLDLGQVVARGPTLERSGRWTVPHEWPDGTTAQEDTEEETK